MESSSSMRWSSTGTHGDRSGDQAAPGAQQSPPGAARVPVAAGRRAAARISIPTPLGERGRRQSSRWPAASAPIAAEARTQSRQPARCSSRRPTLGRDRAGSRSPCAASSRNGRMPVHRDGSGFDRRLRTCSRARHSMVRVAVLVRPIAAAISTAGEALAGHEQGGAGGRAQRIERIDERRSALTLRGSRPPGRPRCGPSPGMSRAGRCRGTPT